MQPFEVVELEEAARWRWAQQCVIATNLVMVHATGEGAPSFDEVLLQIINSDRTLNLLPEFKL